MSFETLCLGKCLSRPAAHEDTIGDVLPMADKLGVQMSGQ